MGMVNLRIREGFYGSNPLSLLGLSSPPPLDLRWGTCGLTSWSQSWYAGQLLEVLQDQIQPVPQLCCGSFTAKQLLSPAYRRSLTALFPVLHLSRSELPLNCQHPHLQ